MLFFPSLLRWMAAVEHLLLLFIIYNTTFRAQLAGQALDRFPSSSYFSMRKIGRPRILCLCVPFSFLINFAGSCQGVATCIVKLFLKFVTDKPVSPEHLQIFNAPNFLKCCVFVRCFCTHLHNFSPSCYN